MGGDRTHENKNDCADERIYRQRFTRYLFKVIHGASVDFIEKYRRQQAYEVLVDETPETPILQDMDSMLNDLALLQTIGKLSLQQQMVIVEFYIHQYTLTEIAARHGVTIPTVSKLKSRALKELRRIYLEERTEKE